MRHLLLDVNVAVDLCVARNGSINSRLAVTLAKKAGLTCWVYVGSIQTLEYVVADEMFHQAKEAGNTISRALSRARARFVLGQHTANFQWLAALAGEGNVFGSDDPEDEQITRALDRFPADSAIILTRDKFMIKRAGQLATTPEDFIESSKQGVAKPIEFIDLKTQQNHLRPQLEKNIHRVLHHGKYIMGPEIAELESKLAEYVGVKHAITAASGTDSLEIALRALGIGPGDEVITVPFTWISTAEVIALVGARPVFVDIDPATYNMNPKLLAAAITPQTKAIMPVSLFGQMADYEKINAIAAQHGNIPVIEDGAQSFGATQNGRRSCGVTTIGSTSFFPAKPCGGYGDGGALFTNDDQLAAKMRAIRTHGGQQRHHHPYVGMNGRLDTIQAAILLAKLECFESEVQRRQEIGTRYTQLLGAQSLAITPPFIAPGNTSVYAQYTIRSQNRETLVSKLQEQGIPAAIYYPKCLHEQPAFVFCGYRWGDFPEAEEISRSVLSLPMHPDLTESEQDMVFAAVSGKV